MEPPPGPGGSADECLLRLTAAAFRRLHGLPGDHEPAPGPDAPWAAARRHRVAPLWCAAAGAAAPAAQRRAAYGRAVYATRCAAEAERLAARLAPRLRRLVLIKGPALARQAWPDPGLRPFDDLDFRCAFEDYPALVAAMADAGYRPLVADGRRGAHDWHFGWGATFLGQAGLRVEANCRFFAPHYPCPATLRIDDPTAAAPLALDTDSVLAPIPAVHLALASLHLFWHGGERLAWLVDVAGLLARNPGAFEAADTRLAREGFARRALHTGALLAERVFGPGLLTGEPRAAIEPAAALFAAQLREDRPPDAAAQRRLHHGLMRAGERTRYTLRRALTPGAADFDRVPLPVRLHGLYWALRPLRVLGTLVSRRPSSQP